MSDTQYTADELRRCADELMKSVDKMIDRGQVTKATYDKVTQPAVLLRAGADAMDAAKSWEAQSERNCREMNLTKNALAKAEARVKELEEALQWDKTIKGVEQLANELREGRQEHNAALQVKP